MTAVDVPSLISLSESDEEVIDVSTKSRPPSFGAATEAAEDVPDLVFDDDNDAMLTAALTASLRTGNSHIDICAKPLLLSLFSNYVSLMHGK